MVYKLLRNYFLHREKSRNGKRWKSWKCKKKCHLEMWKIFAIWQGQIQPNLPTFKVLIEFAPSKSQTIFTVNRYSHLQMNIFGHFNFCENRRNGFRLNILSLLLGTHVQALYYIHASNDIGFRFQKRMHHQKTSFVIFQQHFSEMLVKV